MFEATLRESLQLKMNLAECFRKWKQTNLEDKRTERRKPVFTREQLSPRSDKERIQEFFFSFFFSLSRSEKDLEAVFQKVQHASREEKEQGQKNSSFFCINSTLKSRIWRRDRRIGQGEEKRCCGNDRSAVSKLSQVQLCVSWALGGPLA